jgi:hypothetical protein
VLDNPMAAMTTTVLVVANMAFPRMQLAPLS